MLVPIFGRFGHRLREIAERAGAEVHVREVAWGQVFTPAAIEQAIRETRPKLIAIVHGDTSTTMMQPLDELGDICAHHDAMAIAAGAPYAEASGCETERRLVHAHAVAAHVHAGDGGLA